MTLPDGFWRVPLRKESAFFAQGEMGRIDTNATFTAEPRGGGLTIDKLRAAAKLVDRVAPTPRMIVSDHALQIVGRNFPPSRHRSRRIHKKLVKRYGSEHRFKPSSWQMSDTIIVHPAIMAELQAKFSAEARAYHDRAFYAAMFGAPVVRT